MTNYISVIVIGGAALLAIIIRTYRGIKNKKLLKNKKVKKKTDLGFLNQILYINLKGGKKR